MFAGSYQLTVDDKGRVAIPARLRAQLAEAYGLQVVLTMGAERCIEILPQQVFRDVVKAITALPPHGPATRVLRQRFIGFASECEVDRQGRVSLPQVLRQQAALGGRVMLVGNIDRFELWDEDAWNAMWTEGAPGSKLGVLQEAYQVLPR